MVVQKNWNTDEGSQQSSSSEEQEGASWSIQVPARAATARAVQPCNVQTRQPITRQIAINTLAAMHRRYSLPGPVQPYSRPIAEFRASANKSLDMLRQTLQSAVTKEIDQVIKKYLEKFFVPAVNNIRLNLGVESVSEDQVRAVCRAMLDATRLLYTTPRPGVSTGENNDSESSSSVDSKFPRQIMPSSFTKRKESDTESDGSVKRRKIKVEDGRASPLPSGMLRDPEKWNPARLNQDTLFIMGSHAHKVLGMGNSRGRLYTKHASLPRYPADTTDKEWIASHNLVNAVGGKTYIMVLEDIEELATSEAYRHTSLPMLGELSGFKVPQFMLIKIRSYVMRRVLSGEVNNPDSPQPSTSSSDEFDKFKVDFLKVEQEEDNYDDTMNANQVISSMGAKKDYIEVELVKDDFPDIKVDDNKVEDIDDIKVENMKVEDLDEIKVDDIKVEDFDDDVIKAENYDINVDNIKDEDIKLEHDDTLSVCQQAGDEPDQLVEGLLESDIEFLSRNLGNIENEAESRKTIENLPGEGANTLSLVDEFDLSTSLNKFTDNQTAKCITVASTTSGMFHSVPVAHISAPRLSSTVHYYRGTTGQARTVHHLPATVTIQNIPGTTSQMIRGIPINSKSGTFSTVMSLGAAGIVNIGGRTTSAALGGPSTQYVNVSAKSFPSGNILHNAIVTRNIINRTNMPTTSGMTYVTAVTPASSTALKISPTVTKSSTDYDTISTTKDMIDNACNSSLMLKKVLTLGSSSATKSFMMHNTQKVLSTGFANGITPPPNVTIVSSGTAGVNLVSNDMGNNNSSIVSTQPASTLSASHATLSALLASNAENVQTTKN